MELARWMEAISEYLSGRGRRAHLCGMENGRKSRTEGYVWKRKAPNSNSQRAALRRGRREEIKVHLLSFFCVPGALQIRLHIILSLAHILQVRTLKLIEIQYLAKDPNLASGEAGMRGR